MIVFTSKYVRCATASTTNQPITSATTTSPPPACITTTTAATTKHSTTIQHPQAPPPPPPPQPTDRPTNKPQPTINPFLPLSLQAQTYAHIRGGKDLIGRARTGMGKTLAFAVPVIEKLLASGTALKPGRRPRVLVMAPTRELAKQVRVEWRR